MGKKSFLSLCAGLASIAVAHRMLAEAGQADELTKWPKAMLTDGAGKPIDARRLETREALVFAYPYVSTPCFLINLGAPAAPVEVSDKSGVSYHWPGGVGPARSVVAYSAICGHLLSYPSKRRSVISYSSGPNNFSGHGHVVACCAHHSAYDPSRGAVILSGPAPQPLATVILQYEPATETLYATGVLGRALFDDFFVAYKKELLETYGPGQSKRMVEGRTVATPLSQYSDNVVSASLC